MVAVSILSVIFINLFGSILKSDNIARIEGKNLTLKDFTVTDKSSGAGYKLRDGIYELDVEYKQDDRLVSKIHAEYNIINSQRTVENKYSLNCPEILLIGGSHNFGQALSNDKTLQYYLNSQGLKTSNISTPGYGLVNNYALLQDQNYRSPHNLKCIPKFIVYRFINDHINRDNAKTFFNPYGSHIQNHSDSVEIVGNISTTWEMAKYSIKYSITRLLYYGGMSRTEIFFNLISQALQSWWYFTDKDIERSALLLGKVKHLWKNTNKYPQIIVILDTDYDDKITRRYVNHLKNYNYIKIIHPPKPDKFLFWSNKNCLELAIKSRWIPYEGHPSGCSNKFFSKKVFKFVSLIP